MIKRWAGCLVALVPLAGCARYDQTMQGRSYGLLNPARVDGDTSITLPTGAPWAGNLASTTSAPRTEKPDDGTFATAWYNAVAANKPDGVATPEAKVFLMRGVALSDRLCDAWFDRLAATQARLGFEKDTITSVGTLTAALMGFAGAASSAVGAAAAATGFASNETSSYGTDFIAAPDVGLTQTMLGTLRKSTATDLDAINIYNYDDALRLLFAYDSTCSHASVKRLVNQAVSDATPKTPSVSPSAAPAAPTAALAPPAAPVHAGAPVLPATGGYLPDLQAP